MKKDKSDLLYILGYRGVSNVCFRGGVFYELLFNAKQMVPNFLSRLPYLGGRREIGLNIVPRHL